MRIPRVLLAAPALGAAWLLSLPTTSTGYTLAGFTLNTTVRDFRVYNTWPVNANTNFTPDPSFPGAVGPVLSCWKGGTEWASEPHGGNGLGDPTQGPFPDSLGSGGANFDFVWAGMANTPGAAADRIISHAPLSLGAGVLAQTLGPGAGGVPNGNGWSIQFSPDFLWYDGVGNMPPFDPRFDIQGVATIQLGLALGLGISTVANATMFGTLASGPASVARRTIETDDKTGIQLAYGIKAASKPRILGLQPAAISAQQPMVIQGLNFGATGNEVWFNPGGIQAVPPPTPATGAALVKVTNLASASGGTILTLVPPCNVVDGDVFVKVGATTGGATLSNGFPIQFSSGGNGSPCAQCIGTIIPSPVPFFSVPMPEIFVNAPTVPSSMSCLPGAPPCVSPALYSTLTSIDVGGVSLGLGAFAVDNDNQVRFPLPLFDTLGPKAVTISTAGGASCSVTFEVQAVTTPDLDTGSAIQLAGQTFTARIAAPVALGFHLLLFSGSNLPSCIPLLSNPCGLASLGIGNGLTDLQFLFMPPPNAAGLSAVAATIPPSLAGSGATAFFQGVAFTVVPGPPAALSPLPVATTPVRAVTVP